ncbi:unnamed protein product [Paramecium octaurelia]|uniref:Uncharacterized protein n=1 Tax=Paramecium octaurelia TaxID=43137 RepID=A0A8S1VPC3_PAROT|nr:unnamed protein product [Paramecium octaurelia]
MIEKEEELHCSLKHKIPILMVAFDTTLKRNERILCCQCMENLGSKAQLMSFKKFVVIIEENQKLKYESVENVIMIRIKRIEELNKIFFIKI